MTDFRECLRDLDRMDGQLVSEASPNDRSILDRSTTEYLGHGARRLGCIVENCCVVREMQMESAEYQMFPIEGDCDAPPSED